MSAGPATCGCCGGLALSTPLPIENRPGLSAVAYRIGTHPAFKASLLARLAESDHPALQRLATREDDDFAIALCDGWATIANVLTFYQERIANESWLRTATERRSVRELARLIDYALRPGVAASTTLAFTIESAAGAPEETLVPRGTKIMSVPGPGEVPQTFETTADLTARGAWNLLRALSTRPGEIAAGDVTAAIAGVGTGLAVGDRVLFLGAGRQASATSSDWQVRTLTDVHVDRDLGQTILTWADPLPALAAPVEVRPLAVRSGLFGAAAPDPRSLAEQTHTAYAADIVSSPAGAPLDWTFALDSPHIYLDTALPSILAGARVLLENEGGTTRLYDVTAARTLGRSAYTLSLRATRLSVTPATDLDLYHGTDLRGSSAFVAGAALPLAQLPRTDPAELSAIVLDRVVDLPVGRLLLVQGTDAATGEEAGETVTLQAVEPWGATSRILLASNLRHAYLPQTVTILGNVAPATHGETVREAVGGGDASKPFQRMRLRQAPLTYVPARTASGAASTLELRVNGLLWKEVRSLYEAGPRDRVYTARQQEDGSTVVEFGDGVNGARPPTGRENVTAAYRKGTGLDGLLASGQLSQLITRPLGAKAVANPFATEGAEAPETVAAARANCTLTIHTLDRVVSLQDYEDFARAYGGIAKALATWFWNGKRRGVFLTVAGADGQAIGDGAELRANLIGALRDAGDPRVPVDVRSYVDRRFGARITVATAADRVRETVLDAVRAAVLERFGFEARALGQPVTIDGVLAAVQRVNGVVAANITRLNYGALPDIAPRLVAAGPIVSGGTPTGAELLSVNPAAFELGDLA